MHAMESILCTGWTLHLLFRGDLSRSKGNCSKVKSNLFLLNSSRQPHAIAGIKLAQVNGVQLSLSLLVHRSRRSWEEVLCTGLPLLQKNMVVSTGLKCMGQSITGYGICMSPDILVQARRVSENSCGFSFFFSNFSFLLFSGGRKGFVMLLKPTCVTSTRKENVCAL